MPVPKEAGSEVISGTVNGAGSITVRRDANPCSASMYAVKQCGAPAVGSEGIPRANM